MKRVASLLLFLAVPLIVPLGLSRGAQAAAIPRPGAVDSRIQSIPYDPDQVTLLRGTLGYQFMLEFAPEEKIETVSIGDALGWQVTPNRKANVLFIKPVLHSNTNLTVLTDARRYAFELRVEPLRTNMQVLYIARMIYPQPVQAVQVVTLPPPETPPVVSNYNYTLSGSTAVRPLYIFDDNHKTYFQWAPDAALPAIFAVSDDGAESLVNYVLRGPYVVVDQISPGFALRDGKEVAKIVNHGPTPATIAKAAAAAAAAPVPPPDMAFPDGPAPAASNVPAANNLPAASAAPATPMAPASDKTVPAAGKEATP